MNLAVTLFKILVRFWQPRADSVHFLSPYITRRGSPMGFVFWMERDLFLFEIVAL
jgi:hypothetical protein